MLRRLFILLTVCWLSLAAAAMATPPGTAAPSGTAPASRTNIHDIRGPRQVGLNPDIFYGAGAAVVLLAAGTVLWLWWRRWKNRTRKTSREITAEIYESPAEEAERLLAQLADQPPETPAEYYFQLSAIFRLYLKRRFGLDAPEMTTEELIPRLGRVDLDPDLRDRAREFLRFGDEVKFARAACGRESMTAHLDLVRQVVARTSAPPEPVTVTEEEK